MLKQTHRIERIHLLIRRKATGTPKKLAQRLSISERQLYNILDLMKELGAPVYYNMAIDSYCYEFEVTFNYGFRKKMNKDEMVRIQGSNNLSKINYHRNIISALDTNLTSKKHTQHS